MSFENEGVSVLRRGCSDNSQDPPTKLIVCGLPRSGTTGMVSCLASAGIPFGSNLSNVKEDQDFRRSLKGSLQDVIEYFNGRDDETELGVIGVKFPEAYLELPLLSSLENCTILITTRDPFLVAKRNSLSVFGDIASLYKKSVSEYQALVNLVLGLDDNVRAKIILVGYEKLLSSPRKVFESLHLELGLSVSLSDFCSKAVDGIDLNPAGYLQESNLQPIYCIDSISNNLIRGWCFAKAAPYKVLTLKIKRQNGLVLSEHLTGQFRPDLLEKNVHPTGKCGFSIELTSEVIDSILSGSTKLFIEDSSYELKYLK